MIACRAMNCRLAQQGLVLYTLAVVLSVTACRGGDTDSGNAPTGGWTIQGQEATGRPGEDEAEPAPPAEPEVPASERILGEFEYEGEVNGISIRMGLRFLPGVIERTSEGRITGSSEYSVVSSESDRVVIETSGGEHSGRHTYVLLGDRGVFDQAAPELVYSRITPDVIEEQALEGSGEHAR